LYVDFSSTRCSPAKWYFIKKRDGASDEITKCDNHAKKHRSTGDRELFGLRSPQDHPLTTRRNVSPEDKIIPSENEDEGSIILDFKALSASVESLACGKCGISKLVANKKTTGLATHFDITCQNCYQTVTTLPKKRLPAPGYLSPVPKNSFDDFRISIVAVMLCQELGKGEAGYMAIRSAFDIQSANLPNYSKVEQMISKQAISLGHEIIRENVEKEVRSTRMDPN
jgi:hypothetical protein